MDDKEKLKMGGSHYVPPLTQDEDFFAQEDDALDFVKVKKGFPIGIKIFWGMIGVVWFLKMIQIMFFELPAHVPARNQLRVIQMLEGRKNYGKALEVHEILMATYPAYKKSYYFNIAQCYLACGEVNYNFKKGLELLMDKRLAEEQFLQLQQVVPRSLEPIFLSLFLVYENVKDKKKTYVFDYENLGL